jgi:hypothetical protein
MTVVQFPTKADATGRKSFAWHPGDSVVRRAASAAAAQLAPGDPAFAAIKRHEAARDELCRLMTTEPDGLSQHLAWKKIEGIESAAYQEAFDAIIETIPTTRAGAVALIEHFADNEGEDPDANFAMTLLQTLAAAIPNLA